MTQTPRMKWVIPPENADPWWPQFEGLMRSVDASVYATREDRNGILAGGGTISWNLSTSTLAWSEPLEIFSPVSGMRCIAAAGAVVLPSNGNLIHVALTRYPTQDRVVSVQSALQVPVTPQGDDQLLLAVRLGDRIYWRNGLVLSDGMAVTNFAGIFSPGGDLSGGSTSQTVVGIHDTPIGSGFGVPSQELQVLVTRWTGTSYEYRLERLSQDMILPEFQISSFTSVPAAPLLEVGRSVGGMLGLIEFSASYNQPAPYTLATLHDSDNPVPVAIPDPATSFESIYGFTKNTYGQSVTFTLSVTKNLSARTRTYAMLWVQRAYWFAAAAPGVYDQAWVESQSAGTLVSTKNRTFTVTSGTGPPGEHIYYVYRDGYGDSQFWVNGFQGGFTHETSISITNMHGITENYRVYKSNQVGLGVTQVTVTN